MNILIVSFDKTLVGKLKDLLKEYNVMDVKNVEEALSAAFPFMDVIIYDAVAGSMSEEDINKMYKQMFKDAKYIVLVDDLFPVDMNNLLPPRKIKLTREEAIEKIIDAIHQKPEAYIESGVQLREDLSVPQEETFELSKIAFEEAQPIAEEFEKPSSALLETKREPYKKNNLLIVSFDTEIINNLRNALSEKFQIVEVKTPKEAINKIEGADVIIFDTISGMLAYKSLMDISKEEKLRNKPYILLVDELFTIDVDSIPLPRKYTFTRTTELSKAIQKAAELLEEVSVETAPEFPREEPLSVEEQTPEIQELAAQSEEQKIMSLFEKVLSREEVKEEPLLEELKGELVLASQEEGESTYYETRQTKEPIPPIEDIIKEQLSQEKIYSAISQVIDYEDLKRHFSNMLQTELEKLIREAIQEVLSKIDVAQIVREEAYKALKERLKELLT